MPSSKTMFRIFATLLLVSLVGLVFMAFLESFKTGILVSAGIGTIGSIIFGIIVYG